MTHFTDLEVWRRSHQLFLDLLIDLEGLPRTRTADIVSDQVIRRRWLGGSANIAEEIQPAAQKKYLSSLDIAVERGRRDRGTGCSRAQRHRPFPQVPTPPLSASADAIEIQKMLHGLMTSISRHLDPLDCFFLFTFSPSHLSPQHLSPLTLPPPTLSSPIIIVENLGKKFTLRHRNERRSGLRRFSEELSPPSLSPFRARGRCEVRGVRVSAKRRRRLPLSLDHLFPLTSHLNLSGPRDRLFRGPAGRGRRHHRPQRRGQEHALEDPQPHHRAHRGPRPPAGPRGQPPGGRHRLPPRTDRPRERLPQRRRPGHARAEIRRKFDEIVAFAEVEKFLDTPVKHYSGTPASTGSMFINMATSAIWEHPRPEHWSAAISIPAWS